MSKIEARIQRLEVMLGKDGELQNTVKMLRSSQDILIAEGFEFKYVPEELSDWVEIGKALGELFVKNQQFRTVENPNNTSPIPFFRGKSHEAQS